MFKKFFNFNPFIAPTAASARTQSVRQCRGLAAVPEIRIFTLKTDQARSGAPHFHAIKRLKLVPRSPAFSSSKRLKLVPEPHIFTLDRELVPEPVLPIFHFAAAHIPTKIWGEYPPPPRNAFSEFWRYIWKFVGTCKPTSRFTVPTRYLKAWSQWPLRTSYERFFDRYVNGQKSFVRRS